MTDSKQYKEGYESAADAKNPYSFNSGRKSFTAWKAGRDQRRKDLINWLISES